MTDKETGPELDLAERYLGRLIELTEQGKFAELAEKHYRLKPAQRSGAVDMLRRNQRGHLKLLKWVLGNREHWIWLRSIGKVMALMGKADPEYADDGLMIEVKDGRAITEPLSESVVASRKAEKLKPEIRSGARKAGISPFVFKEVARLRGRFTGKKPTDPIRAFAAIDWGQDVSFDTPEADEENFVAGMSFLPPPPHPPGEVHLPEGFARHPEITPIGNDCYYYFGLASNPLDPLDPMVYTLDHEAESKDPLADTFLSLWLARLRRRKQTSGK